jgi:hypothetical protein
MTLCIAAACKDDQGEPRIVVCNDTWEQTESAGGHVADKQDYIGHGWRCLLAGDISKAEDFAATCRSVLKPREFTYDNVFDKLNEASAKHKEKLTKRLIEMRLGMSFDRFLKRGERELTLEARNRALYEIERIDFGCELIVFGFIVDWPIPQIFSINTDGEVSHNQNFAAIGTGSEVAEAVLYQRQQYSERTIEQTLYVLFEAGMLAHMSNAPGVGPPSGIYLMEPAADGNIRQRIIKSEAVDVLVGYLRKYGPKRGLRLGKLGVDSFRPAL